MKKLSDMMKSDWVDYSMSTIEERAIPSIVDGFKPVHRFLYYLGLQKAKDYVKVASLAGNSSEAGYVHGEVSAGDALTKLASYHANNYQVFIGKGSFGNKFDPTPAATRYIFCKMNPNNEKLFLDSELAPEHPDVEVMTPKYYLPIIPLVLVNGVKGIATGWSVNIPPHNPVSVIESLLSIIKKKKFKEPTPQYPLFEGSIKKENEGYTLTGNYTLNGLTLSITEIPPCYNYESYENILDKLQEKGYIQSYTNKSQDDKYLFEIKLKRGHKYSNDDILKHFKLVWTDKWNLNTISADGKLQEWKGDKPLEDIIKHFYDIRVKYISERINKLVIYHKFMIEYYTAFCAFCKDVIEGKFNFRISDDEMEQVLDTKYHIPSEYIKKVMNTPVRMFTTKKLKESEDVLENHKKELEYYKNTTSDIEFEKDLLAFKSSITNDKK